MTAQIIQGSSVPIFVIDDDHIITHWNPACERMTGFTAGKMIGTREQWRAFYSEEKPVMADLVVDEIPAEELVTYFDRGVQASMYRDGAYELEGFFPDQGENGRWFFLTAAPLEDDQGRVTGAVATIQDITKKKQAEESLLKEQKKLEKRVEKRTAELTSINADLKEEIIWRKRIERALKKSENKFRIVAEFTYDWEYWVDPEGTLIYISPSCERITGYGAQEFMDNAGLFLSIIHAEDLAGVLQHLKEDMTAGDVLHVDFRIITKRGEERWLSQFCQPVFDDNGIHLGRRASNRDITRRKQLEAKLQKERGRLEIEVKKRTEQLSSAYDSIQEEVESGKAAYEALQFTRFSIDHANDMVYWADPEGKIVDVNETTCSKLGYTKDELLSMTMMDINPSLTLDEFYKEWENIKYNGIWRVDTSHYCKSGDAIPVEIHINHIEFTGKEHICVFARDITERQELERLVAIQDKMGSLGRVAAGIAHEIRNPLSTINVYLSALKRLYESEYFEAGNLASIKDAIEEMDNASHKIETVVKRVMDFSKPNQQKMQLMNVNQCVRDAVDLSMVTLRKSEITLDLQLDGNLPRCYLDSQLIEQVMLNLITNAIEELSESRREKLLAVSTTETSRNGKGRCIEIMVADSGSGVSPEHRDKIFDPFFTTKHYGSGIGLSICHRIISDHHGTILVSESKWGGAQFTVEFPVRSEVAD